ncbi:hypothetical protein WJX74_000946 [Apatococcus lobatus]|uniref:Signal recognition particle 9 kDa protein n=2 Tax=Apatococcus TaxID=904362 RepID=A0AAW1T9W4_9CHLO
MYIEDWESFAQQAEALFRSEPLRTRYVLKYQHSQGRLTLKVTDDIQCLQFATDQAADLRKVERLNNLFFALTSRGPEATEAGLQQADEPQQQQQAPQRQQQQQSQRPRQPSRPKPRRTKG